MTLEAALLIATVVLCLTFIAKRVSASFTGGKCVPRVSWRLPFVGNGHQLDLKRCHLVFEKWTKQYGPVFEVSLYGEKIVVLNDYRSIHEALVRSNDAFAGRPKMYRTDQVQRNRNSIVWQTYNSKLVFLRKEVLKFLKAYGDGKGQLEEKCFAEFEFLIQRMKNLKQSPFNPSIVIQESVSNIMMSFLIGRRFEYNGQEIEELQRLNSLFNTAFGSGEGRSLDILPWLRLVKSQERQRLEHALSSRDVFWEKHIRRCIEEDSVIGNLLRLQRNKDDQNVDLNNQTIKEVFTNLIMAGTDTTSTAIVSLLTLVLQYPDVQSKIQAEIDDSTPGGRAITLADRDKFPYTQAVIMETLRYIAHVPLAVPHCTIRDGELLGYHIPKDTTVYVNIWAAHHDPAVWEDPYSFIPERFLDTDGTLVPPQHPDRKRLLVFGAGRRVCLGEVLAKNRLFLFVTSLFQNFTFLPEDPTSLPGVDPRQYELGLVLHPQPFLLKAVPRQL